MAGSATARSGSAPAARLVAAGAALALHLAALAGVVVALRSEPPSPPAARVRLATFAVRKPAPPPPTARQAALHPDVTAPRRAEGIVPLAQPAPRDPVDAAPAPPAIAPKEPVARTAVAATPPARTPAPPAADALARWRAALWSAIAANRPRGASGAGTAVIRFRLDRGGGLLSCELARSSGNVLLDRQALRAVRRSAPFPAPPADASEADLTVAIPLRFGA